MPLIRRGCLTVGAAPKAQDQLNAGLTDLRVAISSSMRQPHPPNLERLASPSHQCCRRLLDPSLNRSKFHHDLLFYWVIPIAEIMR